MQFRAPRSCLGALRRQKVEIKKHLFSVSKTIAFELGRCLRRPKSSSESPSESGSFFNGFWDRKVIQNDTKMAPGRHPNRCPNRFFFGVKIRSQIWSQKGRQVPHNQDGPSPGGTLLDHESIILRYLERADLDAFDPGGVGGL